MFSAAALFGVDLKPLNYPSGRSKIAFAINIFSGRVVQRAMAVDPPNRLFIPEVVCSHVLHWAHASKLTCHAGLNRKLQFLRQWFWWPSMTRDIRDYIAVCPVCARESPPTSQLLDSSTPWRFLYALGRTLSLAFLPPRVIESP